MHSTITPIATTRFQEQTAILTDLASAIGLGERIVLDVTHGFRYLSMLAEAACFERNSNPVQAKQNLSGAHVLHKSLLQ